MHSPDHQIDKFQIKEGGRYFWETKFKKGNIQPFRLEPPVQIARTSQFKASKDDEDKSYDKKQEKWA